jgi:hypothetical protein
MHDSDNHADAARPPDGWSLTSTGHLLSGLTTMHSGGVSRDRVFLTCDALDHLQPDVLNRLNENAYPALTACGHHNLAGH